MERSRLTVPQDLQTFLEFMAREAIRSQPKDIIRFTEIFVEEIKHAKGNKNFDIFQSPEIYEAFRDNLHNRLQQENDGDELVGGSRAVEPKRGEHDQETDSKFNVDEAATKIQAKVRGYLVRKQVEATKKDNGTA